MLSHHMRALSNVMGFDDAPFVHGHRGDVRLIGVLCARTRLDGVLSGKVRRDGANAQKVAADTKATGPPHGDVQRNLVEIF